MNEATAKSTEFTSVESKPKPEKAPSRVLRLWPAVVIILIQLAMSRLPKMLEVENPMVLFMGMMWGPILGAVGIGVWWLFASRVPWSDRFLILGAWLIGGAATLLLGHSTLNVMVLLMLVVPMVSLMWVVWLVATGWLAWPLRRWGLAATILATWGFYTLIRIDGLSGAFDTEISWRWNATPEQLYLTSLKTERANTPAQRGEELIVTAEDWPSFRGSDDTSRYQGPPLATNWQTEPLKALWKQPIGPGWGSFAIVKDRLFTQEQRGEDEVVACYDAGTGSEIWAFRNKARFEELVAGTGPRATPTFSQGKIYAVGATGLVHCLDALTGQSIWNAPMVTEAKVELPPWGYASSPVIFGQTVVVLPGRPKGAAVVGFDAQTGNRLWSVGGGEHSYTSAHRATLSGVEQVLALTSDGLIGIDPAQGKILWIHEWPAEQIARCVQPFVADDTVLISTYFGVGSRKIKVTRDSEKWATSMVWESKEMKPYFNDLVVQDGYAYGFDGNIFCCLNLSTGKRAWKGGRYGSGQVLLLERQKMLLVLSEEGEVVLLEASPKKLTELGRFSAINGKTWNHPVVVRGKLFVRNGQEMACFEVAPREQVAGEAGAR